MSICEIGFFYMVLLGHLVDHLLVSPVNVYKMFVWIGRNQPKRTNKLQIEQAVLTHFLRFYHTFRRKDFIQLFF